MPRLFCLTCIFHSSVFHNHVNVLGGRRCRGFSSQVISKCGIKKIGQCWDEPKVYRVPRTPSVSN